MNKKIFKIKSFTKKTSKLSKQKIEEIYKIKDSFWKYGKSSQASWFKQNVKRGDMHNLLVNRQKLVGYTLLRKREMKIRDRTKKNYFLIDTVIIRKDKRKKKLSNELMKLNNSVLLKYKKVGFLLCKKKLIKFYSKYSWEKISNKKFTLNNAQTNRNGMIFNIDKKLLKNKKNIINFNT